MKNYAYNDYKKATEQHEIVRCPVQQIGYNQKEGAGHHQRHS